MPDTNEFDKDVTALKNHFDKVIKKYKINHEMVLQYFNAIAIRDAVAVQAEKEAESGKGGQ